MRGEETRRGGGSGGSAGVTRASCTDCGARSRGTAKNLSPKVGRGSARSMETAAAGLPWRQPQRVELIARSEQPQRLRFSDVVCVADVALVVAVFSWQPTRRAGPWQPVAPLEPWQPILPEPDLQPAWDASSVAAADDTSGPAGSQTASISTSARRTRRRGKGAITGRSSHSGHTRRSQPPAVPTDARVP